MMWYHVTTELRLRECYQAMLLEEGWLHTDADREKTFDWLNDVAN